jgi:sugar lactone lactonase YvrE
MKILLLAAAVLGLTAVPAAASTDTPLTCPTPTVTTFHTGPDWFENAEFDGLGRIWIANLTGDRLEAYGPAGDLRTTVAVHAPGAIRRGPDGFLYANFGNNAESHGAPAGVVRFNPLDPKPVVYATGDAFGSANGAEFDSLGNLYVADPFAGLIRIRPGGRVDPDWRPALPGADGVATLGGQVFTTLLFDPKSAVVSVPRTDPDVHKTVVELGDNKLPDDMAFGPDHKLYVATYGSGEIFRADLHGRSCVLLSGLDHPTSVRFSQHFGRPGDMYVTQASGSVLRVRF